MATPQSWCSGKPGTYHDVIFDPDTNEMVCTRCGETSPIDTSVEITPTKHSFSPGQHKHPKRQQSHKKSEESSIQQIDPTSRKHVAIPKSKLNADYTLTGTVAGRLPDSNRDVHGNRITRSSEWGRYRWVDKNYVNSQYTPDKSLRNAMWIIATLTSKLNLSELIKERAAEIYTKAYDKNAVRGRSTKWLATASLFYACKEKNIFRNPNDFVVALDPNYSKDRSGRKDLFMNYKILTQVLDLEIPPLTSPVSELGRIATLAGISEKSVRKAMQLYEMMRQHDKTIFYGKSPAAISVCILYIATKYMNEHVKQDVITSSGQISTVTLRKRCDEYIAILRKIDPELPTSIDSHRNIDEKEKDEFSDLEEDKKYEPTKIKGGRIKGRIKGKVQKAK